MAEPLKISCISDQISFLLGFVFFKITLVHPPPTFYNSIVKTSDTTKPEFNRALLYTLDK